MPAIIFNVTLLALTVEEEVALSDPWWKRRKKKAPWYNEIHDELEKLGDLIDETMQKVFENSDKLPVKRGRVKGYSIKTDSKGKPNVRELDSRQSWQEDEFGEVEPLVDFVESDDVLIVLVALSAVKKDNIDLRVTESCLTVSVDAADFEWFDELRLPAKVKPNSAWASYKNGVLEVRLEKLKIVRNGRISVKK